MDIGAWVRMSGVGGGGGGLEKDSVLCSTVFIRL